MKNNWECHVTLLVSSFIIAAFTWTAEHWITEVVDILELDERRVILEVFIKGLEPVDDLNLFYSKWGIFYFFEVLVKDDQIQVQACGASTACVGGTDGRSWRLHLS